MIATRRPSATPAGGPDSPAPGPSPAALQARLDWRFLLPDPDLGSWRWLGGGDDRLRLAIRALSAEQPDGPAGLVVGQGREGGALARAFASLRPGGWLYLELGGRAWPPSGRPPGGGLARDLLRAGFEDVGLTWPWPDHERTRRIVPLGGRAPHLALAQADDAAGLRLAGAGARALDRLGLLGAVVPAVGAFARRPGPGVGAAPGLAGAILADPDRWGIVGLDLPSQLADLDWLLLTPRFRTSRHVVLLGGRAGSGRPAFAAKLARTPGDAAALSHTASILERLAATGDPVRGAVPRLLANDAWAGHPLLVTTYVPGKPLSPAVVREDRDRYARAILEWLFHLPQEEGPMGAGAWSAELVEPALATLEALAAVSPPLRELAGRARRALEPWRDTAIRRVFEHGDLSHPNLLWSTRRGLGVIDWESGRPDGLPLHDLTFSLTYLAGAAAGARASEEIVSAFGAATLAADGWARPLLREYGERMALPAGAVAPLVVAAWVRLLGRLPERAFGAQVPDRDAGAWIEAHRFAALLRSALDGWASLAAIDGRG